MRILLILITLLFVYNITFAQCNALYPIYDKIEEKYGYVNCTGEIVISPKFRKAYDFSEGLGRIEIGDDIHPLTGFINVYGKIVIEPNYGNASDFSEGMAAVLTESGWGYINSNGKVIIHVSDTSKEILPPIDTFSDGYAIVYTNKGTKFINKQGKMVMPKYYDNAISFYKGMALVTIGNKNAVINKEGQYIFPQQDNKLSLSEDGIVGVKKENYWSYFDIGKKILFRSKYELEFSEGISSFEENGKWGFINKLGNIIIKPKFNFVYNFKQGLAVVGLNSKFGVINKKGDIIIPLIYDYMNSQFENELIYFQLGEKFGYLNQKGKVIWMSN